MACILLWSSAVRVHDSQAYRKTDVTRERIKRVLCLLILNKERFRNHQIKVVNSTLQTRDTTIETRIDYGTPLGVRVNTENINSFLI